MTRDYQDRPRRDYDGPRRDDQDRPRRDYDDRPPRRFEDRPRRTFEERPRRDYDDRPRRQFDDRPPRLADRPPRDREWAGDRDNRPQPDVSSDAEPRADLIAEGDELVAGRRPVEEAFGAGRETRRLLVVPQRRAALEALVTHATREHVPIVEVEGGTLTSLAGFDGHQGIALVVGPRRWATIDDVLARAIERSEPPFVLALDSVEDPRNLGALLRSAEAAGVHGVILPTRRAAPLTAVAVKASAGASEHLPIVPVDDLAEALGELHARGLRVVGADAAAPMSHREADLRGPIAIVIGSEGTGFSAPTRRRLDQLVKIPMRGRIASLNASVAGSLLLFEVAAQREAGRSEPQEPPQDQE